ncbi:T6SS immunity protein Tli4 family protein [Herbaspirillum sp. RTI4]|uniref:T6SS immunity protein Tli4 family protein n=1 Tax=Herbaspirillum sp. RTI4 TaxID=3048640 RepID=UPI002AB514CB|nr:T6SS immunity protein Tli4 family protein [Herbaspirillum sp. RTI4]MDY7579815.1 T6SS immunity protein Tli4 family protein [Herbaspirillum sp. RTI4]MDY7579816.1 T6SS immunity protein Tli4 family protein [Herbaspirillum sp. RTI4]
MDTIRRQLLAAIAIGALWPLAACHPHVKGLSKEKTMKKYPLKPYAVGRYLIDLPEAATEVSWGQRIKGTDFTWHPATKEQYLALLEAREQELQGVDVATRLLANAENGAVPQSRILLFERDTDRDGLMQFEAFRFAEEMQGYLFFTGPVARSKVAGVSPSVNDILKRIQPRLIDPATTDRGACFDHAFVSGVDPANFEDVGVMVSVDDITLGFSTQVIDAVDTGPTLLERSTIVDRFPEVTLLRQSAREVARLNGEELAFKNEPGSGLTSHSFEWDYRGKPNSIMAPSMGASFRVEQGVAAALLPDEELLGLWDAVLGSIRLRTGAV